MADSVLQAERVRLRHPGASDLERFLEFVRENGGYHQPWVYPPSDEPSYARFLRRANTERNRGFLVFSRDRDELVGVVELTEIIRGVLQSAFMGFYGSERHGGTGYMTEAIGRVIRLAFEDLRLHRVEANIQPANERSIAMARRLGFHHEGLSPRYLEIGGRWRDHERWAILADGGVE